MPRTKKIGFGGFVLCVCVCTNIVFVCFFSSVDNLRKTVLALFGIPVFIEVKEVLVFVLVVVLLCVVC